MNGCIGPGKAVSKWCVAWARIKNGKEVRKKDLFFSCGCDRGCVIVRPFQDRLP
jgi:hypothetical protein